jgi:hypothetical protein
MNHETHLYYSNKIEHTLIVQKELRKKLAIGSIGRLLFFLFLAFSIYHLFQSFQIGWFLSFIGSIIGFLGMISWYVNIKNQENYQNQLNYFFQNELNLLDGGTNSFDDGKNFDDGAGFWSDLDLFGKGSLYHCINRTITEYGKIALAHQFKNNLLSKSEILNQQDAIKIYGEQMDLIESVIAISLVNKTEYVSFDAVFHWLKSDNHLHQSKWAKFIRFALPVFNCALIFISLYNGINSLLGIVFVMGWVQISSYAKYLQSDFNLLGKKESILKQYALILQQFEKINAGNSTILLSHKKTAKEAHAAIKELSKISSRIDQRLNLFLITFINPIFLYDIQNMFSLEAWKMKHSKDLTKWISLVGEVEKLNSFAVFSFNNKEYIYPTPLETVMEIHASELAHPLISKDKRIPNNISITGSNKVLLITGSNMSGKTTFLRTLGINLVLAQTGLPLPAVSFLFSPMQIFSSIRISDSLQENTSYFMAELKKLSAIKEGVKNNKASLVLIDEILRGTNSEDKYFGSAGFVKEMLALNCITLFATHDLKLSELENDYPNIVVNYCFESMIENNDLFFNYKIQRGVAKNRNASFLMKKMGII